MINVSITNIMFVRGDRVTLTDAVGTMRGVVQRTESYGQGRWYAWVKWDEYPMIEQRVSFAEISPERR